MALTHKRKTILVGEGVHYHALVGKFEMDNDVIDFAPIKVKEDSLLKHERTEGVWSKEHKTLALNKGNLITGLQVEYNPFSQSVSRVWD
jgi:hypothetical protein